MYCTLLYISIREMNTILRSIVLDLIVRLDLNCVCTFENIMAEDEITYVCVYCASLRKVLNF